MRDFFFLFGFLLFIFTTTFNYVSVIAAPWGGLIDNRDFFSSSSWPTVVNQLHLRRDNTKLLAEGSAVSAAGQTEIVIRDTFYPWATVISTHLFIYLPHSLPHH